MENVKVCNGLELPKYVECLWRSWAGELDTSDMTYTGLDGDYVDVGDVLDCLDGYDFISKERYYEVAVKSRLSELEDDIDNKKHEIKEKQGELEYLEKKKEELLNRFKEVK